MTTSPTSARDRRRHALRTALSGFPGTSTPTRPREAASAPHGAASTHPRHVTPSTTPPVDPEQPAEPSTAPAWDNVARLTDELAHLGDDLPADLSPDERRAAILARLRPPATR